MLHLHIHRVDEGINSLTDPDLLYLGGLAILPRPKVYTIILNSTMQLLVVNCDVPIAK